MYNIIFEEINQKLTFHVPFNQLLNKAGINNVQKYLFILETYELEAGIQYFYFSINTFPSFMTTQEILLKKQYSAYSINIFKHYYLTSELSAKKMKCFLTKFNPQPQPSRNKKEMASQLTQFLGERS